MQIHRLDEEYTIPVTGPGDGYRIGPVTGPSSDVQVHVLHLPPGGSVAPSAPAQRRLVWVVSGEGVVRGADGGPRRLRAGEAACIEAGEEHSVESERGLVAVRLEGRFEVLARSVLREIVVVDYDPEWPAWFETVRAFVWPAVAELAVRVDHVGSTAVPGLAAKPIVDLDVVLPSDDLVGPATSRLQQLGYRWLGELGVPGRQAFLAEPGSAAASLPAHHLYVVVEDNRAHLDHWLLRDLLRCDAEARRRYGELKRHNAATAGGDIDRYGQAKAGLVAELLARARAERGLEPVEYWQPPVDEGP
jgi:GrpB-like predicted nucleotidyltransferase (UPF0157 family)/quercetin dioxygenase-like cupin family protein